MGTPGKGVFAQLMDDHEFGEARAIISGEVKNDRDVDRQVQGVLMKLRDVLIALAIRMDGENRGVQAMNLINAAELVDDLGVGFALGSPIDPMTPAQI